MFVVEDTNNNKFGGYITASLQPTGSNTTDHNSFLFSLKSNGRVNGMQKFEIQSNNAQYACCLYNKSSSNMIRFGGPSWNIRLDTQNYKSSSYAGQFTNSYNYHNTTNAFIPNSMSKQTNFTPKRITVIQMK